MGFMMFVIEIIWLGNHLNGGAKYLAYVTQLPDVTCKIITVLGFGIYVFIGGYMAVVTTDAVQFIAILIGFLTIAVRAILWQAATRTWWIPSPLLASPAQ